MNSLSYNKYTVLSIIKPFKLIHLEQFAFNVIMYYYIPLHVSALYRPLKYC